MISFTQREVKKGELTDEEIAMVEDGRALAIPIYESKFNGTTFAILSALAVAMLALPIIGKASTLAYVLGWVTSLVFMGISFISHKFIAKLLTALRVERAQSDVIQKAIQQAFDSSMESNGTLVGEDGLNKDSDGSGTVH